METKIKEETRHQPGLLHLNGIELKVIATVLMCIDHVGAVLLPNALPLTVFGSTYSLLRVIGRLAFPIYAFLLAEGAIHTHDWRRYAIRIAVTFFVSEWLYNFVFHGTFFYPQNQNIFLTLLLGLFAIRLDMECNRRSPGSNGAMMGLAAAVLIAAAGQLLRADYGFSGVFMIYLFYFCRNSKWMLLLSLIICNVLTEGLSIQAFAVFSWFFLLLYNGTGGKRSRPVRNGFYLFYPVHILVIGIIKMIR